MLYSNLLNRIIDTFCRVVKEVDECKTLNTSTLSDLVKIEKYHANIVEERKTLEWLKSDAKSMPWLAKAYSDFYYLRDVQIADYLKTKKNPASKAAEICNELAAEKRNLTRKLKEAEYRLNYLEHLFPSLEEIIKGDAADSDIPITEEQTLDETLLYVTKNEYAQLSPSQRNQLALDRYKQRNHSKTHIGKMYERYIGYLYESRGFDVVFYGIKKGLEDMGRDLICTKDNHQIEIVQCKNWSARKEIHENAICQLYGTTIKFKLENKAQNNTLFCDNVVPVFITTTKLSETALEFAKALGVDCLNIPMSFDYPMIKCNISDNGKIYHLPFDQQYDTTAIDRQGEFYARTVAEAEAAGFRRAKRWNAAAVK